MTVEWDYHSETSGVENLSLAINGLTTGTTYGIKMNAVTPIGRSIDADVVYIVCAHCRGQRQ